MNALVPCHRPSRLKLTVSLTFCSEQPEAGPSWLTETARTSRCSLLYFHLYSSDT